MINRHMESVRNHLLWGAYSVISLLLSIWIAWHALAQVNFLYPVWYSALDIQQTVNTYAPENRYKAGFQATDSSEHQRLFAEIVAAVQSKGKGLSEIFYLNSQTQQFDKLLTKDEVIHLQDVANLVQQLNLFSILLGVIALLLLPGMYLMRMLMPGIKRLMVAVIIVILPMSVTVMLLGAQDIFYWLHTKIFPADHPWFFYYEDSLMSTLMKAPVLFAPLSLQLLFIGVVVWWLHLVLIKKLMFFNPS